MIPLPPVYSHFQAFAVSDTPIDAGLPRCALRGSLDPITGIFYRAPEHHARMRTLQACDKCRVRKAKCSGDHPVCERCRIRGLTCHYAPERRARRWIKTASPDASELDTTSRDSRSVAPSSHRTPAGADRYDGEAGEAVQPGRTLASSEDTIVPLEQPIAHPTKTWTSATSDDTPGPLSVEEDVLTLPFDPYTNDPRAAALFQPIHPSSITDHDAGLVNHDPVYIDRGLTAAPGSPERRVPHPFLFHPPLRPHQSGPPFPLAVDDQLPFCCATGIDMDSPGRSHSACTSLTASPVLTRPSSRGLPTPINSYPGSPFTLASLSPTLGPYTCDPHTYPLFSTEMIPTADQGQCGTWTDEMTQWREIKDGDCAWEGNVFLDMDSVF